MRKPETNRICYYFTDRKGLHIYFVQFRHPVYISNRRNPINGN